MPEGPEVLRCADNIAAVLEGKRILKIETISGKLHREGITGIESLALPTECLGVQVKGKRIYIGLRSIGQDFWLLSTLGMSGWWYPPSEQLPDDVKDKQATYNGKTIKLTDEIDRLIKYARVKVTTDDGIIFYLDPRNFGNMKVLNDVEADASIQQLGDDPLDPIFNGGHAMNKLGTHPGLIGEALLDQSRICGIGNIYRAEILYHAGISPYTKVSKLNRVFLSTIVTFARNVLLNAYNGTYSLSVYSRATCPHGHPVRRGKVGGRTMWWCPDMQSEIV